MDMPPNITASYSIDPDFVLSGFKALPGRGDTLKSNGTGFANLFLDIARDRNTREALIPPTVGWFSLTFSSTKTKGVGLQVLGFTAASLPIHPKLTAAGGGASDCGLFPHETDPPR